MIILLPCFNLRKQIFERGVHAGLGRYPLGIHPSSQLFFVQGGYDNILQVICISNLIY